MHTRMYPVHPGEILREEFMRARGLSASALARALNVSTDRIVTLVHEGRALDADTALRLAFAFNTTPEYWMNLQTAYELQSETVAHAAQIAAEVSPLVAHR